MSSWTVTDQDRLQMEALGITETQVRSQLAFFQTPPPPPRLVRPCTLGDGIRQIAPEERAQYIQLQEKAALRGRFQKIEPASGASSRMFQYLLFCFNNLDKREIEALLEGKEEESENDPFYAFMNHLSEFAFFEELKKQLTPDNGAITNWAEPSHWQRVLKYLLTDDGLNYCHLPKGLITFHRYPQRNRTSFEEHLVEAVQTIRDEKDLCRIHFTISPEHQKEFSEVWEEIRSDYEQTFQVHFQITFSFQSHSTDTLAVNLENTPFREDNGRLLFRPGGHGALLKNVNDLQGDLLYLKNIDNVQPDHLREQTIFWKKILGGNLARVEETVHHFMERLTRQGNNPELTESAWDFCRNELSIPEPPGLRQGPLHDQRAFLLKKLNRPIRVCGMVKNEGEPGGGPFWVRHRDGTLTLQIIEKSQVDPHPPEQQALWSGATHFNPVDLVCAVRDYRGMPFNLPVYSDSQAVFISEKSYDGKKLKALELPGLWNGGMSDWNTIFVEVPGSTFTPVKTVNDLLRPEHQPKTG